MEDCIDVMFRPRRGTIALLVAVAVVCAACPGPSSIHPRPTPKPRFGDPSATSRDSVDAYAQSLRFDSAVPFAATATSPDSDSTSLSLEPEIGAGAIDSASLASGRIVARLVSNHARPIDSIAPGITYIWVDRRDPKGRGRMLYIPERSGAIRTFALVVSHHPPATPDVPAQVVMGFTRVPPIKTMINVRCSSGCCHPSIAFSSQDSIWLDSASTATHRRHP